MSSYIIAIDQGTTSSRAIVFDDALQIVATAQQEIANTFPQPGWVQQDAAEIWSSVKAVITRVVEKAHISVSDVKGIGITNQRETTIVWDRRTGKPVHDALVWQSRQTADLCDRAIDAGWEKIVKAKTGLMIDPYFSGSKIRWILDRIPDGQKRAAAGELYFGNVDSWLAYNLTAGRCHVTDVTNASRTMLMNIDSRQWDEELLSIWDIPAAMLPQIKPSSCVYGTTDILGPDIPIASMIGDQQAALFGQMCFEKGQAKNTYGTGCFLLFNTGTERVNSKSGLVTTIGWQIGDEVAYALEGSVFVAGAAIQWLRDGLKVISNSSETEKIAEELPDSGGVYVIPAFTGLGAPYWRKDSRGAIFGLTRGTTTAHLIRATLESLAYQSYDVINAMTADTGVRLDTLQVDGGACRNNYLMQFQADLLQKEILRPVVFETTAMGAAMMAGLAVGVFPSKAELKAHYAVDRVFKPLMTVGQSQELLEGWSRAIHATMEF